MLIKVHSRHFLIVRIFLFLLITFTILFSTSVAGVGKYKTNKFRLKERVRKGGWIVAWSNDISETDALKGAVSAGVSVASENPGPFQAWLTQLIERTIASMAEDANDKFPEELRDQLRDIAQSAIREAVLGKKAHRLAKRFEKIDFKAGAIVYSGQNYLFGNPTGLKTFGVKPYVAVRLRTSGPLDDAEDATDEGVRELPLFILGDGAEDNSQTFWLDTDKGTPHYVKEDGKKVSISNAKGLTIFDDDKLCILGDGKGNDSNVFFLDIDDGKPHYVKQNGQKVTVTNAKAMTVFDKKLWILGDGQGKDSNVFYLDTDDGEPHYIKENGKKATVTNAKAMTVFQDKLFILGDGQGNDSNVFFLDTDDGEPHYIKENGQKVTVTNAKALTVFENKLCVLGDGQGNDSNVFFLDTDNGQPHYIKEKGQKVTVTNAKAFTVFENKLCVLGDGEGNDSYVFFLDTDDGEPHFIKENGKKVTVTNAKAIY